MNSVRPGKRLARAILLAPKDPAVAVARRLHRKGVSVSMVGRPGWEIRTRWASSHIVEGLSENQGAWIACLSELGRDRDGVLIPGSDSAVEFLVQQRSHIPECLRSFESPNSAHMELMDKVSLYALAAREEVRFPWTLRLHSRSELDRVADEATYPCLLKPAVSHQWRRLFGQRRVFFLRDPDDLTRQAGPGLDAGLELLITEHIPGPDRNLEGAVTIRRADGSYALAYGRRKLRQYPPRYGSGSLHESAEVPETMALAKRVLDAARFVGVSIVEAKRHAETGEVVLIEVNPRVPQGFAIGDACGADASWRLYATLAGIPLPRQPRPATGVKVVVPSLEPRAVVGGLLERRFGVRELLATYRGVRDLSGLSWRDPGSALALAGRELRAALRSARRRKGATDG